MSALKCLSIIPMMLGFLICEHVTFSHRATSNMSTKYLLAVIISVLGVNLGLWANVGQLV